MEVQGVYWRYKALKRSYWRLKVYTGGTRHSLELLKEYTGGTRGIPFCWTRSLLNLIYKGHAKGTRNIMEVQEVYDTGGTRGLRYWR